MWRFGQFAQSYKVTSFEFSVNDVTPECKKHFTLDFFAFFVSFMEKQPPIRFYCVFDHLSQACEVTKVLMIKIKLEVGDAIHAKTC